jgi:cysteine desulfurase
MSSIYLDYAATTPLDPEVLRSMLPYLQGEFGNPSSIYSAGQQSRAAIDSARATVARILGFDPQEIIFTSGATESDNLALSGVAWAARLQGVPAPHIVTTAIEHSAVLEQCEWLRSVGFEVSVVGCDEHGVVDPESIRAALTDSTALVSVMYANNEVGSIQPISAISRITDDAGVPLHVDATQATGLLPLHSSELGADLVSLSAHKFYGPKGTGVLAVRRNVPMSWQQHGGGQERGRRGGTENVAGIVGTAFALERADAVREQYAAHCRNVRDRMWQGIEQDVDDVWLNGPPTYGARLPNNLNVGFEGIQGETMLLNLDLLEIAASAGSACTVGKNEPSHVLLAMGRSVEEARSSVRFSVGRGTSPDDIDIVVDALVEISARVRSMARAQV